MKSNISVEKFLDIKIYYKDIIIEKVLFIIPHFY